MRNYFELVEEELDTGKEFVLHEGSFNECSDVFESMLGFTYYTRRKTPEFIRGDIRR